MDDGWTDHLINPQTVAGLYDGEPPTDDFALRELRLERRGPSCLFRGDLASFPDHPRDDWDDDTDRLEIRFSLSAIENFSAQGRKAGGRLDLEVQPAESGLGVVVRGRGEYFDFEVEGVALQVIGMTVD